MQRLCAKGAVLVSGVAPASSRQRAAKMAALRSNYARVSVSVWAFREMRFLLVGGALAKRQLTTYVLMM